MTKTTGNFLQQLLSPFKSKQNGNESDLERIAAHEQKNFTFQTLASATKDFHRDHKLGEGGFGPVFKGKLSDGREIAVKKLSTNSNQGKKEFTNEAKLLARVQHRNVVSLVGYCVHGAEKLLVYEYVANESLDKFIFSNNPERRILLDWKRRFDIIVAVARGLLYLHEDCHCKIIHRDIKASNILLDDKWIPKIADFGMARLFPEGQTHVNTRIAGTNGYMAPEYLMHGLLTPKADVFSFGVVILEMISGQKNSTFNPSSDAKSLLEWAYNLYKEGKSSKVMDPTLASSAIHPQVEMCVQIGLLCTQSDPHLRPDMRRVGIMLSKKPGTLEEPTRPGYPGSRYRRRSRGPGATSSTVEVTGESSSRISSFATDTSSHSRCASASASASTSCHSNVSASASASASTSCHSNVNMDTRKKQSMQG